MDILFRERSLLLPVSSLLGSINNLSKVTFTSAHRERLVLAAVVEHLWLEYQTVSAEQRIAMPYADGYFARTLVIIFNDLKVKPSGMDAELNALRTTVFDKVSTLFSQQGLTATGTDTPLNTYEPGCYDHGYRLSIVRPQGKLKRKLGSWLKVTWYRPTVNMREMSMLAFINLLAKVCATRKKPASHWQYVLHNLPLSSLMVLPSSIDGSKRLIQVIGENLHAPN